MRLTGDTPEPGGPARPVPVDVDDRYGSVGLEVQFATAGDDFEAGLAAPFGTRLAGGTALEPGAEFTVAGASPWNHATCTRCRHTFRRGDRVRCDDAGEPRHRSPGLGCLGDDALPAPAGPGPAAGASAFVAGLEEAWRPPANVPVVRLDAGHHLLAPPVGGLLRASCLFCAHTFRPGEAVVICPCRPSQQRCRAAVHRDPAAGLTCWESWRPGGALAVCPVTLVAIDAPGPGQGH
ncbi:hypothetical protein AB0K00_41955 [Dactylosporangium sp. NPDC049525]|uniref:hypothetical protein n=1 Tax=Dactylosporangium sp. NPDC049525 TaxID=3154730 RepID=UPI00342E3F43